MSHAHSDSVTLKHSLSLAFTIAFLSLVLGQQTNATQIKLDVCHSPPDYPANTQIISVGLKAAQIHIEQHGDYLLDGAVERCDSIDNTCDGVIDEGFDLGAYCEQGQGACYATGSTVCAPDETSLPVCNAEIIDAPGLACDQGPTYDGDCDGTPDVEQEACSGLASIEVCGDYNLDDLRRKYALGDFASTHEKIAIEAQEPSVDHVLQSPVCQTYGVTPADGNPANTCLSELQAALSALNRAEIDEQTSLAEEDLNTKTSASTQFFTDSLASNATNLNEKIGSFGTAGDSFSAIAAAREIFGAFLGLPGITLYVSDTAQSALESCSAILQSQLTGVDQCRSTCQRGDLFCRDACSSNLDLIDLEYKNCVNSLLSQSCSGTQ